MLGASLGDDENGSLFCGILTALSSARPQWQWDFEMFV